MIDWPFTVALAAVCLLILRQFFMLRTIRKLGEENFDLKLEVELLQARSVPVYPYTGDKK